MADTDADIAASTKVAVVALIVVVVDIDAATSAVLFLCAVIELLAIIDAAELIVRIRLLAVEVLAEIFVLGRPNLTLLTASAVMVVTEAVMLDVRILLDSKLVETNTGAVAEASTTVAIEALTEGVDVREAEISEVRTRLAAKVVLELTEAGTVASLTRTASIAVVLAIAALAEASTIFASRAASGADARGLKPSILNYPTVKLLKLLIRIEHNST